MSNPDRNYMPSIVVTPPSPPLIPSNHRRGHRRNYSRIISIGPRFYLNRIISLIGFIVFIIIIIIIFAISNMANR